MPAMVPEGALEESQTMQQQGTGKQPEGALEVSQKMQQQGTADKHESVLKPDEDKHESVLEPDKDKHESQTLEPDEAQVLISPSTLKRKGAFLWELDDELILDPDEDAQILISPSTLKRRRGFLVTPTPCRGRS